jgi:hypothetical protein
LIDTMPSISFVVRAALAFVALAALVGSSGCATVKPWQREDLSRRAMTQDQEKGESRFQQHARGAREGGDGGTGEAGGGCGCN